MRPTAWLKLLLIELGFNYMQSPPHESVRIKESSRYKKEIRIRGGAIKIGKAMCSADRVGEPDYTLLGKKKVMTTIKY